MELDKITTCRRPCIMLTARNRESKEDEGLNWVFLKVMGKRPSKRAIDEFLSQIWGIQSLDRYHAAECQCVQTGSEGPNGLQQNREDQMGLVPGLDRGS